MLKLVKWIKLMDCSFHGNNRSRGTFIKYHAYNNKHCDYIVNKQRKGEVHVIKRPNRKDSQKVVT